MKIPRVKHFVCGRPDRNSAAIAVCGKVVRVGARRTTERPRFLYCRKCARAVGA